jgi:hypothetical protein
VCLQWEAAFWFESAIWFGCWEGVPACPKHGRTNNFCTNRELRDPEFDRFPSIGSNRRRAWRSPPASPRGPKSEVRESESPGRSILVKHPVSQSTSELRMAGPKKNAGNSSTSPSPQLLLRLKFSRILVEAIEWDSQSESVSE